MASHPDVRGQGFGEAVLKAILEWVGADDSGDLWCNARETAIRFYERHGFRIIGERFEIPNAGPHFRMWLPRGRDRDAAH
jgi:ribosomal protein S18 acetylase RimI-like enzyme